MPCRLNYLRVCGRSSRYACKMEIMAEICLFHGKRGVSLVILGVIYEGAMKVKFGFAESAVAAIFAVAFGAAGVSSAATVNATVDFNDGVTSGGSIKTYVEDGFQFYDARIVGGPCEFGGD